jgi:hypothetical protein
MRKKPVGAKNREKRNLTKQMENIELECDLGIVQIFSFNIHKEKRKKKALRLSKADYWG